MTSTCPPGAARCRGLHPICTHYSVKYPPLLTRTPTPNVPSLCSPHRLPRSRRAAWLCPSAHRYTLCVKQASQSDHKDVDWIGKWNRCQYQDYPLYITLSLWTTSCTSWSGGGWVASHCIISIVIIFYCFLYSTLYYSTAFCTLHSTTLLLSLLYTLLLYGFLYYTLCYSTAFSTLHSIFNLLDGTFPDRRPPPAALSPPPHCQLQKSHNTEGIAHPTKIQIRVSESCESRTHKETGKWEPRELNTQRDR